jgi:hypothetical protein
MEVNNKPEHLYRDAGVRSEQGNKRTNYKLLNRDELLIDRLTVVTGSTERRRLLNLRAAVGVHYYIDRDDRSTDLQWY